LQFLFIHRGRFVMTTEVLAARYHQGRMLQLLVVGLCSLVSFCGGGADSAPGAGESRGAAPAAVDPCALITTAEASEALGATVEKTERPSAANIPPRLATCRYVAPRGQGLAVMTVLVQRSDTDAQARAGFTSAKEQFPAATTVPGLGDEAFAIANQISVLRGRVCLNITGDFDLERAKALGQKAVQRLP
jgi:hypothetical protein